MPGYNSTPFQGQRQGLLDKLPGPLKAVLDKLFPTSDPLGGMAPAGMAAKFPAKVPPMPKGKELFDAVYNQMERLHKGFGENIPALREQLPELELPSNYIYKFKEPIAPEMARTIAQKLPSVNTSWNRILDIPNARRFGQKYFDWGYKEGPPDESEAALQKLLRDLAD